MFKKSKPGPKRKPESELAISIATYHKSSDIIKIGGRERAREIAFAAIEKEIKKVK